ncbi:hypothetical protein M3Y94_00047500 [Aphelenchoides besseyi]|nr:hypothetical protein M3Y94_00047500 [Aphelenchoides besseyi]KAI6217022.1 hypothetical protein M3Y95_01246400 [Aphelenchoides besseyi]
MKLMETKTDDLEQTPTHAIRYGSFSFGFNFHSAALVFGLIGFIHGLLDAVRFGLLIYYEAYDLLLVIFFALRVLLIISAILLFYGVLRHEPNFMWPFLCMTILMFCWNLTSVVYCAYNLICIHLLNGSERFPLMNRTISSQDYVISMSYHFFLAVIFTVSFFVVRRSQRKHRDFALYKDAQLIEEVRMSHTS